MAVGNYKLILETLIMIGIGVEAMSLIPEEGRVRVPMRKEGME